MPGCRPAAGDRGKAVAVLAIGILRSQSAGFPAYGLAGMIAADMSAF
jgi:hypothetical protein